MSEKYYDKVLRKFWKAMDGLTEASATKQNAHEQLAHFGGCVLRMCGHDFMDFASGLGGSDACTDMDNPDNAGLKACLSEGSPGEYGDLSMRGIYQHYCTKVSLADFLVMAAQAVMTYLAPAAQKDYLYAALKGNFRYGRSTRDEDCVMTEHILPNPDDSCNAVKRVFVDNMGLSWTEATALMGVHTLGAASTENSGFDGFWDTREHSASFNNHFYVNMLAASWCPETVEKTGRRQWRRCEHALAEQGEEVRHQMMLDTDLCLAYTAPNGQDALSAAAAPCCAWVHTDVEEYPMGDVIRNHDDLGFCSKPCKANEGEGSNEPCFSRWKEGKLCCGGDAALAMGVEGALDCGSPGLGRRANAKRQGYGELTESNTAVRDFAADVEVWISSFVVAWRKATENGAEDLLPLVPSSL